MTEPGDRSRIGIVYLSEQMIRAVLDLPDDMEVVSIRGDWERLSVAVMVRSAQLRPVPPACEPPNVGIANVVEIHECPAEPDARPWVRYRWDGDERTGQ